MHQDNAENLTSRTSGVFAVHSNLSKAVLVFRCYQRLRPSQDTCKWFLAGHSRILEMGNHMGLNRLQNKHTWLFPVGWVLLGSVFQVQGIFEFGIKYRLWERPQSVLCLATSQYLGGRGHLISRMSWKRSGCLSLKNEWSFWFSILMLTGTYWLHNYWCDWRKRNVEAMQ